MQFMPAEIPAAFFTSVEDPTYQRLAPKLRDLVDAAAASGLDTTKAFSVTVKNGEVDVAAVLGELTTAGSVDEVNALAAPELPEIYTSDGESLAEDKHYSDHLTSHWGF